MAFFLLIVLISSWQSRAAASKVELICPLKVIERFRSEQAKSFPMIEVSDEFEELNILNRQEKDNYMDYIKNLDALGKSPEEFTPAVDLKKSLIQKTVALAVCMNSAREGEDLTNGMDQECDDDLGKLLAAKTETGECQYYEISGDGTNVEAKIVISHLKERPLVLVAVGALISQVDYECEFDQLVYVPRSHMLVHKGAFNRAKELLPQVISYLDLNESADDYQYIFTGYDFGGSVAQVLARLVYNHYGMDFRAHGGPNNKANQVIEITFGSPNVIVYGGQMMANYLRRENCLHFASANDTVAFSLPYFSPTQATPVRIPSDYMLDSYSEVVAAADPDDQTLIRMGQSAFRYHHIFVPPLIARLYHGAFAYFDNAVLAFNKARKRNFALKSDALGEIEQSKASQLSIGVKKTDTLIYDSPDSDSSLARVIAKEDPRSLGPDLILREPQPNVVEKTRMENDLIQSAIKRKVDLVKAEPIVS